MPVPSNVYLHDSDRAALQTLKSIPGFTPLLKGFMKLWNEQMFHVENMATNLRISDKQLPQYYQMLPPICEKLGIEVPELYMTLDVRPNAYTSGDTKPFIVMTSGLLETLPEELIPSVLAHECGHIACHHVLYRTMGTMILNGTIAMSGLGGLLSFPLQTAFYYWMRCSELSADRAAAICDGTADKVVETCMRFAGFDKDISGGANVDEFLAQAAQYRDMMGDKWNKTLEFLMFNRASHPLNAVRAYECNEWQKTEHFTNIIRYVNKSAAPAEAPVSAPVFQAARQYLGQDCLTVQQAFQDMGFVNIELRRETALGRKAKNGQVLELSINDQRDFRAGDWHPLDAQVTIVYYAPLTEDEIAAGHPDEVQVPDTAKRYTGRDYQQVALELTDAGFKNIVLDEIKDLKKGWFSTAGSIERITIGGQAQFEKGAWFKPDTVVRIVYHTFAPNSPDGPA